MQQLKKYIAEFMGTGILVLFGCGAAVLTGDILLISLAFGFSIIVGAYTIGKISGCHVNPAVSLAMLINGKLSLKDFCGYVIAQIAGAFAGSGLLYAILSTTNRGTAILGANGFDAASATGISMVGAILVEIILTFVFVGARIRTHGWHQLDRHIRKPSSLACSSRTSGRRSTQPSLGLHRRAARGCCSRRLRLQVTER